MKRLILGSVLAVALAVGLTVGPSIATPEKAPKAEAQSAANAAWIFYGPWVCKAWTGVWAYPKGVYGPDVSPPGYDATKARAYHDGNAVRVSPVQLYTPSWVSAMVRCPHSNPILRAWGVTVQVGPITGWRTFRYSGEAHWF